MGESYTLGLPQGADITLNLLVALLQKWNKVYNLTASGNALEIVQRHILDSLVLCHWLPTDASVKVMDVGSGAGFPVIPLAIARPKLRFVSIESNGKKTRFQQQAMLELKLPNVDIRNERIQNVVEQCDFVTSRAFTAPEGFLMQARSVCRPGGRAAVMLGQAERLPKVLPPPFMLEELEPVHIPGTQGQRHIAICRCG